VPLTAESTFNAETVIALKLQNGARRLDIRFVDAAGAQHVVSLPIAQAAELAKFITDASTFMAQLKRRAGPSAR
jgi:hypothetical protein